MLRSGTVSCEEAFGDPEAEHLYHARELLAEWVNYYNGERLHPAPKYLRPVDYYSSNLEALSAEQKRKLTGCGQTEGGDCQSHLSSTKGKDGQEMKVEEAAVKSGFCTDRD